MSINLDTPLLTYNGTPFTDANGTPQTVGTVLVTLLDGARVASTADCLEAVRLARLCHAGGVHAFTEIEVKALRDTVEHAKLASNVLTVQLLEALQAPVLVAE